jgi:hypothetical protein
VGPAPGRRRSRARRSSGAATWALAWPRRGESIHAANLEHVAFLTLLPLAAGLAATIVRRPGRARRPAAALGLAVAGLVTCHPGLAVVHGAPLAALVTGAAVVRHRRRPRRARARRAALALATAVGAGGSTWFTWPLLAERAEFGRGVEVPGADEEASLLDYADRALWFSAPGEGRAAVSPGNYLSSAYLGATALALGAFGVAPPGRAPAPGRRGRRPRARVRRRLAPPRLDDGGLRPGLRARGRALRRARPRSSPRSRPRSGPRPRSAACARP